MHHCCISKPRADAAAHDANELFMNFVNLLRCIGLCLLPAPIQSFYHTSLNCYTRKHGWLCFVNTSGKSTLSPPPFVPSSLFSSSSLRRSPHVSAVHWQHDAGSEDVPVAVHRVQVVQHLWHLWERCMYAYADPLWLQKKKLFSCLMSGDILHWI